MMDNLRTAANSVVLKIIFGIIIVSFILTGVSGYLIGGGKLCRKSEFTRRLPWAV